MTHTSFNSSSLDATAPLRLMLRKNGVTNVRAGRRSEPLLRCGLRQERDLSGVIHVVLDDAVEENVVGDAGAKRTIAGIVGRLVEGGFGQGADRGNQVRVRAIEVGNRVAPSRL